MEELIGKKAEVGSTTVTRLLPRRAHRTIGAWCFADHFGPADVSTAAMAIGPHPHIGLQTVTWLFAGEALHTDSLGSEQLIRAGELNLMTAARGIAHAERSPGDASGSLHGMQLWVALPEETRFGEPAFAHHAGLPHVEIGEGEATVFVGAMAGAKSPARHDTPLVGAEIELRGCIDVPLDPSFEHGVLPVDGPMRVDGEVVAADSVGYLPPGRASIELDGAGRVLLLGGEPFGSPILMSWNFVARTRDELDDAYRDWATESERFGDVWSPLARVPAPAGSLG